MRSTVVVALMALVVSCSKEPAMTDKKPISPVAPATGPATGVQLAVQASGPVLEVTWTNGTAAPIKLATHVFAGEKHYDWITVRLGSAGGPERTLQFLDDRDESGEVVVDVAAGASVRESIDLAAWAARRANGSAPLAPGAYQATVVYDSTAHPRAWAGRLETTTLVTVP